MNIATGPNGQTTKFIRYDSRLIAVDQITVPPNRRAINSDTVRTIAASVQKIGLQNPISVTGSADKGYTLIAGAHRLEAVRSIDEHMILASIMKVGEVDARLWEISENLHRADLSKLERSEQVAEWVTLTTAKERAAEESGGDKPREPRAVSKGGRGKKEGTRAASRELGIPETNVRQSVKIAAIAPEAKEAAVAAGLDDNQSALLKVAAAPKEQQAEVVAGIVAAEAAEKTSARTAVATTQEYDTVEINGEPVRCTTSSKSELAAIRSLFRRELTSFTSNEFEERLERPT